MAARRTCIDDPGAFLDSRFCLFEVSKDARGKVGRVRRLSKECRRPPCRTLRTVQPLRMKLKSQGPCDSGIGEWLSGDLVIQRFVSAFNEDGERRGVHAGDFVWTAKGIQIEGRMSGVTNLGTHRKPVFDDCQRCDARGVMEGRLCGRVIESGPPELRGGQVIAAYRFQFEPGPGGIEGDVAGVIEGLAMTPCR